MEFRKYKNRKIYNTKTKSYTTLSEIKTLIFNGNDVKIKTKSGEDITDEILKSILVRYCSLNKETMIKLIRRNDEENCKERKANPSRC